jgi:teichuronic acid biosynthesis glycosyltransferase TuaH
LREIRRGLRLADAGRHDPDWDGMIVLCAAASYSGVKAADRHMAEHLSRLVPVLYVDPPLSVASLWRDRPAADSLRGPRLRVQEPGLARLTPLVQPGPSRHALTPTTSVLARWFVRNAVGQLGGRVQAVVSAWPQYPVFGCCDEQVRVYWSQDDFVGGAGLLGLDAGHLDLRERGVAASADFVAAVSPVLAETWRDRGSATVLIPNGADLKSYADVDQAAWPVDVRLPGPVAGFVGQLNARTDLHLLEAIAGRGRSLLLVGPKDPAFEPERFRALLGRPNVRWVGPKPFEALPSYLRLIDVGIVPYGDSPFNRGSFPLKVLEYLAAGRAVVATDLPSIRWLATDLVTMASGPGAFSDAVDRSLGEVRSPAVIEKRRAFAAMHDWAGRAADLLAAVSACRDRRSAIARAGTS